MARELTAEERAVLEHVVEDADFWWDIVNLSPRVNPEVALAAKVSKYRDDYLSSRARDGQDYRNRRQREVEAAQREGRPPPPPADPRNRGRQ